MQVKQKIKPIQLWATCIHLVWRMMPHKPPVHAAVIVDANPAPKKDDYWDKFFKRAPFCVYETTGRVIEDECPASVQRLLIGG